jgi:hypothetical protein
MYKLLIMKLISIPDEQTETKEVIAVGKMEKRAWPKGIHQRT